MIVFLYIFTRYPSQKVDLNSKTFYRYLNYSIPPFMTREEYIEICQRCTNRGFDVERGVVCGLTKEPASFEERCEHFNADPSAIAQADASKINVGPELTGEAKGLLRTQQDVGYGIIGGAAAAVAGALVWALVTVTTNFQIGYMAIGVGLLVGLAVRHFGYGIDQQFGVIGAFFALAGCALGNLLSQLVFIAEAESLSYYDVLLVINGDLIVTILRETFSPMDVVFYGIAGYEGYRFAFRTISEDMIADLSMGRTPSSPFAKYRLPVVSVLFVVLVTTAFFLRANTEGTKTYYYDSGKPMSAGKLKGGIAEGPWEYYYENGNLKMKGVFASGKQTGDWQYYEEDGHLYRKGSFRLGMQDGEWNDYYPNGATSSSGSYHLGRASGEWTYYYPDGTTQRKGILKLDKPDGTWEMFFENGKRDQVSTYVDGELSGLSTSWTGNGIKILEEEFDAGVSTRVRNKWNNKGEPEVINGEGVFKVYHDNGGISESGAIRNGYRSGIWKSYYADGAIKEEGEFINNVYLLKSFWSPKGEQLVKNGNGEHDIYNADETLLQSGPVQAGLRTGTWTTYFPGSSGVMVENTYSQGKLDGVQYMYYMSGKLLSEGTTRDNLRDGTWIWYHENEVVETSATFVRGKKEGEQKFYDSSGVLLRTERYKDGKLVDVTPHE
jgi:antitoxin component YwqK of YwqJK toxin-antitoxin module